MLCGVGDPACAPCWVFVLPLLPFHLTPHTQRSLRGVPPAACNDWHLRSPALLATARPPPTHWYAKGHIFVAWTSEASTRGTTVRAIASWGREHREIQGTNSSADALHDRYCSSIHDLLFCPALQEWLSFSHVQIEHTFGKAMRLKESACPRCTTITREALYTQFPKLSPAFVPRKAAGF
jgi:hypothetical protein